LGAGRGPVARPHSLPGKGEHTPMATKTKPQSVGREVYAPIEAFVASVDGIDEPFTTQTLVREGHPILDEYGHLFRKVHVKYDVEAATAGPGETRG